MFIGRYYHTIEDKGRLSLPKPFRDQHSEWVVTRGLDGGLYLFPQSQFEEQVHQLADRTFTKKHDRDFVRYLTNDAHQVSVDSNGRVLLPEYLRQFANLIKEAVVVGSFNYIEIWNPTTYHTYIEGVEQQAEHIAEALESTP